MIRPEFFTDEDLTGLPPLTRLLFIGLWTVADREGRLRDRPKTIKFSLFPADDCDVDAMLDELASVGSVRRYEVDGEKYIDIPGFPTYQNVHPHESKSNYPPHPKRRNLQGSRDITRQDVTCQNLPGRLDVDVSLKEEKDDEGFEEFWSLYPRREKKTKAASLWKSLNGQRSSILTATRNYRAWADRNPDSLLMLPTTWLSIKGRDWEDWVDGVPTGRDRDVQRTLVSKDDDW